jgi:hypothetical protein
MTRGLTDKRRPTPRALAAISSLLIAGCSSGAAPLPAIAPPDYLGAKDVRPAVAADRDGTTPRVSSSKVLSAIVFERVTGLEVDPARLVDR